MTSSSLATSMSSSDVWHQLSFYKKYSPKLEAYFEVIWADLRIVDAAYSSSINSLSLKSSSFMNTRLEGCWVSSCRSMNSSCPYMNLKIFSSSLNTYQCSTLSRMEGLITTSIGNHERDLVTLNLTRESSTAKEFESRLSSMGT